MKTGMRIGAAVISACVAGAAALYCRYRKKTAEPLRTEETTEERFQREWTSVLEEHARVFNGLFSGLARVENGSARKPEKVLREWCQRTQYRWENEPVDILCRERILPLIESGDAEGLRKWTCLLLDAAAAAGITREEVASLVLTEDNAEAYIEWDGDALYPEEEVEILSPAWYQSGKVLEQGQCRKAAAEAQ